MVKELDRESRDILEAQLENKRDEPESIGVQDSVQTPDSARIDIDSREEQLNKVIDQYNSIAALADELMILIEDRAKDVQVAFNSEEDITLRDSMRRVFGLDTDIVLYKHYKACLELREQLAKEDREALKEQ